MTATQYRVLGRLIDGNRISLHYGPRARLRCRLSDGTWVSPRTFGVLIREAWILQMNNYQTGKTYYVIDRLGREAFWSWSSEEKRLR